jgi:NAD-dependent DNA ligase
MDIETTIQDLQTNLKGAEALPAELLRSVLDKADHAYYDCEAEPIFPDPLYDALRDVYLAKLEPEEADTYKGEVSIKDGKDMTTKMPKGALPIYMSSLEKLKNDPKALARWCKTYPGPYWLRAKLDGVSMLYFRDARTRTYHLMTRHKKDIGGIADPLLRYMRFPPLHPGELVRGELIMSSQDFAENFKGKPRHSSDKKDETETIEKRPKGSKGRARGNGKKPEVHNTVRASVGGALGAVVAEDRKKREGRHASKAVDPDFLAKMRFVAYEFMPSADPSEALSFENQLAKLQRRKFEIVDHFKHDAKVLTEKDLEVAFSKWRGVTPKREDEACPLDVCPFDTDGVVFSNAQAHPRPTDKEPKYVRAFKMDFADQMAETTVVAVHWNPSAFGYLKPQVEVAPVRISGANFTFCSGKHAAYIRDEGIGPGAKITLIRSNDVIPDIKTVHTRVEPSFPTTPYTWISEVEIAETEESDATRIRSLHRFFSKLGVENLGEASVAKLYEEGYRTVKDWVGMEVKDIGGKIPGVGTRLAQKWVHNLRTALGVATLDSIINGAALCGRGVGSRRMAWVFDKILKSQPDPMAFFTLDSAVFKRMCLEVDGLGNKVVDQIVGEREEALAWWSDQIPGVYGEVIMDNTRAKFHPEGDDEEMGEEQTCEGLVILMTGFHDKTYEKAIVARGGTLAKSFTKKVNMLLVKDLSMKPNGKTRKAQEEGIQLVGAVDFKARYML